MTIVEILALLITVGVVVVTYFKWTFTFWKKINLPTLNPSVPFGTIENPFTRKVPIGICMKNTYQTFKSLEYKHGGIYAFSIPQYMPIDLEIIKRVLQTDFQHFYERAFYYNEKDDPLSAHLFAISGPKWKNLRAKLTPTFTSGKMKMMFDVLVKCSQQMLESMDKYHETKAPIDIKDVSARYTTDVIGCCAFGLECNSFKSPDAEFRKFGKKMFERPNLIRFMGLLLGSLKPELANWLKIRFFAKDITDFFMKVVSDTVTFRETNRVNRNDMLQLLIDLRNSSDGDNDGLTMEELAAQAIIFFAAGFETSSTTMTFCLYELAKHPEIQQRVRDEINEVLSNGSGKITYDSISEMKYMGQVVDETLRKYPPLPFVTRRTVTDYKVPNTDVIIPKGISTIISILGIHHDPEYYTNPDKFDPERFTEEERRRRVPFTFIPFGEGPRVCIGLRFGLMQTKLGLCTLLKSYKFSLHTVPSDPLKMDRRSFILTSETGIYLDIEKA